MHQMYGDIVVWNTNVGGGYGHIDFCYQSPTNSSFIGFDQNWNNPLHCSIETHNYNNVSGFLRLKTTPPSPPYILPKNKFKWILYTNKLRKQRNA